MRYFESFDFLVLWCAVAAAATPRRYVLVGVIALLVLAVVYFAGSDRWLSSGGHTTHSRPYEYVYLDSARVDSYLGQLTGGDIGSENRTETTTNNANVGLQVDTVGSAAASTSRQLMTSAVVTLTEADRFYKLLDDLKKDEALATVDATSNELAQQLESQHVHEGMMIRIENAFVHLPPYLSVYPQLRYASFAVKDAKDNVFGHPQLTQFGPTEVTLVRNAQAERQAFIARAGANPRLPFTVSPSGMTVVIPARFANLTGDPSLLSTDLTVVGKVVFDGTNFGDGASETTYLPALLGASDAFLGYLGVNRGDLEPPSHSSRPADEAHEARLHDQLFHALAASLSYGGRVIEVVPVAIYD